MFLADGEEMPRPSPPWEGCPCSRLVTFSVQPRSCLSPLEKGNRSLASSTMERELGFAFQRLGAAAGETSLSEHVWATTRRLVKARCVPGAQRLSTAAGDRGNLLSPAEERQGPASLLHAAS